MFPHLGHGLGLRTAHYARASEGACAGVDWFEVITENFLVAGGNPRRVLRAVRAHRPIALYGVSLSIGSTDPLDDRYLDELATLCAEIEPAVVSDHLCWSSFGGHTVHDLWPLPYTAEALAHVVARVARVQKLPLNTPVEIAVTFPKAGELSYACAMNMDKGVISVQ